MPTTKHEDGSFSEQTLKLFAVYDHKVGAYMAPFTMRSSGEAERAFRDTVNDPSTVFYKHAEDFTLFRIGWFGVSTGCLVAPPSPEPMCKAFDVLNPTLPLELFNREAG